MKKITLIVVSALVALMGLLEVSGIINLAIEPGWHAWLKIIIGIVGVALPFVIKEDLKIAIPYIKEKQSALDVALYVIGGALVIMGVLGLIPGLNYAIEPVWHPVLKLVAGGAVIYLAYMKTGKTVKTASKAKGKK